MTGQRKSVKILGAIELFQTRFHYRQETVFNASTYLSFLQQLARRYRRQGERSTGCEFPSAACTAKVVR